MDRCRFVAMEEKYLPDVLDIYNYYVLNSTATFHIQPLSAEEMRQLVFFRDDKYRTFVIFDGDTLCGYCILRPYHQREAYAHTAEITLYLKHDHTNRGIGGIAFDFLEEFAKRQNMHVLITSICSENTASIKLCEKKGFIRCAHFKEVGRKFGRILDVVYYQKILDTP